MEVIRRPKELVRVRVRLQEFVLCRSFHGFLGVDKRSGFPRSKIYIRVKDEIRVI